MIMKTKTAELQLSANAITQRQSVVLRADLSDLEWEELEAKKGQIEFSVDNKTDGLAPIANDPRAMTWTPTPPTGTALGIHTARVRLTVDTKPIAAGEARIHVVETTALNVSVDPATEVEEGTLIKLQITDASGSALPATGSYLTLLGTGDLRLEWDTANQGTTGPDPSGALDRTVWNTAGMRHGTYNVSARLVDTSGRALRTAAAPLTPTGAGKIKASPPAKGDTLRVALQRSAAVRTREQPLWSLIRSCTTAIGGSNYTSFIERVLCPQPGTSFGNLPARATRLSREARDVETYGVGAYGLLKTATQVFLLLECGGCHAEIKDLDIDEESARLGETVTIQQIVDRLGVYLGSGHLPYIDRVLDNAFRGQKEITRPHCYGVLSSRIQVPCLLELIWSYWHEEGMLVQTMGAITRRFQNVRGPGDRDPLAHLEIDPLRPLNNLLWGYIQDEWNLLTVKRRAYEYDHHYGMAIYGKAVPPLQPADSRSKFLEGFHNLLHASSNFFKEDNDTTVIADGFPLLNALKEVHLLLAQGAHNQFGDLPWTARTEMLMQQWLLSRPEMRDFLQSRAMVPYKEPWMAPVDTMKALQGWSNITVTHFRDLGVYGEQILLSVRYGDWIDINDEDSAKNWARYWRPEIQGYLHAYRAVTGVDLTNPDAVDHTMPTVHLQKRLAMQRAR